MPKKDHSFVAWEEHILCHERGNRVVHYYLKEASGDLVLVVIGTERSIRHMMYVVSDEFVQAYGSKGSVNGGMKWRARREVVDWLTSLVSGECPSEFPNSRTNDSTLALSMTGSSACRTFLPDQMVSRKLKVQDSEIEWSGIAWICAKQLKHYPALCRNGAKIAVHSFVFIMALDDHHYLGYLEDMYEDRKGKKKVKVRWFHHNQEVKDLIPQLNPHPREVFITPHVQVISAECVDGPAAVLTPKHYEECITHVAQNSSSGVCMCFRQFKNHKLQPFALAKLRGYSNQAILASLNASVVPNRKVKCSKLCGEDEKEFVHNDHLRVGLKRTSNYKGEQGLENSTPDVKSFGPANQITNCEPIYPKLKFRLSTKSMGTKIVGTESQLPMSFSVDERIELLCQDSGIRGCWFQCKILQVSQKFLKVQYFDVEDADGLGCLEEWIPAFMVAAPDKLGMRCSGRLTIRPYPPKDWTDIMIEVGTPVDAWWSDGWWEGVVTGAEVSGTDTVQVYCPGEERFLTIQKKKIRASKDWDGSSWVDIKARPDILLYIPENLSPSTKVSTGTTKLCGSEVDRIAKHEVVDEDGKGLRDFATSVELLKIARGSNSIYCPLSNYKVETNNFGAYADADAGNEDGSGLEEDLCPV
ncbi:Agenet domain containing protein [Parasponia andersonii]|uniref:Agenet domain containing protein n=1 Tax=Parasponia andersonii TaxID=3476 RepID=A0A2P5ANH6_PARAD|nr:Agenet domain containing protein [Parasponia andersonii]